MKKYDETQLSKVKILTRFIRYRKYGYTMNNEERPRASHVDESDRGACYYCGKPASIKVGLWSDTSAGEESAQSWRGVLICNDCNGKHKWVDEQVLPDTYLGY